MNNTALKILSVFIAVALWVYVFSSEKKEASVRIPVTLAGEQEGTMAVFSPEEVTVRIYGPQPLVLKESIHKELSLIINISDLPLGTHNIRLSRSDIKGGGVEIIDIAPNQININIEATEKRTLSVLPIILDEPPKGYRINPPIKVTPPQAVVEGMYAAVLQLRNLQTEKISIADLRSNNDFTVPLVEYDGVKSITPDSVVVTVDVVEDIVSRRFQNMQLACLPGTYFQFSDAPEVEVIIQGRRDRVEALASDRLLIPIDCDVLKARGKHTITPSVRLIDNITITGIIPEQIDIEVLE